MPNIRLGRHARRLITIAVIVVVAAGGGAAAWATASPSGPSYRTATVAQANVTQTLLSTGTIEPVSQANASFPVSGQVASVSVGLGSHVTAGQVLARLTTTALASQVSAAQSTVATAAARLAADQASQTAATSTTSATTTPATSGTGSRSSTASALAAITRQQAAVRGAQQRLDAQLTAAKTLLAKETAQCAVTSTPTSSPSGASPSEASPSGTWSPSPAPSSSSVPTVTASPRPTPTASAGTGPPGGTPTGGTQPTSCQAAITKLLSAQTRIATAEQSLAGSESALSSALGEASASIAKAASSSSGGGSGSGSAPATAASSHGVTAAAPATAAQLAADQASLDAANAQQSVANQNLAAATLLAPITGAVAEANITPGQQVTGSQGSGTTANFVVESAGGQEAVTTVSDTAVGKIRVGQPATVTLDGSADSISGEVDAIGMLSTTSSTGSASYPVTIGLAADAPTLFAGSDAQVAITLAEANEVITVPTSAVKGTGAATFVTLMRTGKPVTVRVTVGASGPTLTQITSGLTVGEQVVLADMSTPLPTNTSTVVRGLTTGGGGFGGGRTGSGTTGGGATGTGGNRTGG
jgi:multidrug efflux pump subunit AcrA (membrane-fusion protein)